MARAKSKGPTLDRREVVARLIAEKGEALVVSGLGAPNFDVCAAGDGPYHFPLWGGMGGAAMVGLGLALAQPGRRVIVVTGDGEMLMGLGSLATIAVQRPSNLAILVLDNERYGETGMQATHTAFGVDLPAIARAAGFAAGATASVTKKTELAAACALLVSAPGPVLVNVKVREGRGPTALPPRDGPLLRSRFRSALLGAVSKQ